MKGICWFEFLFNFSEHCFGALSVSGRLAGARAHRAVQERCSCAAVAPEQRYDAIWASMSPRRRNSIPARRLSYSCQDCTVNGVCARTRCVRSRAAGFRRALGSYLPLVSAPRGAVPRPPPRSQRRTPRLRRARQRRVVRRCGPAASTAFMFSRVLSCQSSSTCSKFVFAKCMRSSTRGARAKRAAHRRRRPCKRHGHQARAAPSARRPRASLRHAAAAQRAPRRSSKKNRRAATAPAAPPWRARRG